MIKLTKEITDKDIFLKFVDIEENQINEFLENQKSLKNQLISNLKNYTKIIGNDGESDTNLELADTLSKFSDKMNLVQENITQVENLITNLEDLSKYFTLDNTNKEKQQFEKKLDKYNKLYTDTLSNISLNANLITYFVNDIKDIIPITIEEPEIIKEEIIEEKKLDLFYEAKTLLISDVDSKVYLPYEVNDVCSFMERENVSDPKDIIEKYYTLPMSMFKPTPIARFKEAYNLVRNKDNGTIKDAIELGLELLSNYNVHPAIISACKTQNELDIYLSCLEYNELEDFRFFKVDFKLPPQISKKALKEM